jgi:hypothetical protein
MFFSSVFSSLLSRFSIASASLLTAGTVHAAPITYLFSGTTDGTLQDFSSGGAAPVLFFNPTSFQITAIADTANVTQHPLLPSPIVAYAVANQSVIIDVTGLGLFTLTNPGFTQLFGSSQSVFIGQLLAAPYFGGQTFAANGYDLRSSVTTSTFNMTDRNIFYTDRGVLVLANRRSVSDGKFSASVGTVPLPGTVALLVPSLLGISLLRVRKNFHSVSADLALQSS